MKLVVTITMDVDTRVIHDVINMNAAHIAMLHGVCDDVEYTSSCTMDNDMDKRVAMAIDEPEPMKCCHAPYPHHHAS